MYYRVINMSLKKIIGAFLFYKGIKYVKSKKELEGKYNKLKNEKYLSNNNENSYKNNINELIKDREKYNIDIENIINNIDAFVISKIIHGMYINNTIAFSKNGYIFIKNYENSLLTEIKNVKNIYFEKDDYNYFYCKFHILNNEITKIKIILYVGNEKYAKKLFNEITEQFEYLNKLIWII